MLTARTNQTTSTTSYIVSVYVEGAAVPVLSERWPNREKADARAETLREQIKRASWCHKVYVMEGK